jgi:hypothetical protein
MDTKRSAQVPRARRAKWEKPTLTELAAGSAENTPGISINDGPLETIGS